MQTLLNCCAVILFVQIATASVQAQNRRTMITINLHCMLDQWQRRLPIILDQIISQSPDIIAFQEVCSNPSTGESQIAYINNYLNHRAYPIHSSEIIYAHAAWGKYDEHLMIVSKHSAIQTDKGLLPASLLQRVFVALKINDIWYINTHLAYRDVDAQNRKDQLQFIINRFASDRHIIMGDFNSSPKSWEQSELYNRGYYPFFPDRTFTGDSSNLEFAIDGFWFDPKILKKIHAIRGHAFLKDPVDGLRLSDHYAVKSEFEF